MKLTSPCLSLLCGVFLLAWTGCADADAPAEDDMAADTTATMPSQGTGPMAMVQLQPTQGNQATGSLTFRQEGAAVLVSGTIRGLAPGTHHVPTVEGGTMLFVYFTPGGDVTWDKG